MARPQGLDDRHHVARLPALGVSSSFKHALSKWESVRQWHAQLFRRSVRTRHACTPWMSTEWRHALQFRVFRQLRHATETRVSRAGWRAYSCEGDLLLLLVLQKTVAAVESMPLQRTPNRVFRQPIPSEFWRARRLGSVRLVDLPRGPSGCLHNFSYLSTTRVGYKAAGPCKFATTPVLVVFLSMSHLGQRPPRSGSVRRLHPFIWETGAKLMTPGGSRPRGHHQPLRTARRARSGTRN